MQLSRWNRGLVVAAILLILQEVSAQCPKRCICQNRHVQCMYLGLESIPYIPSDTVVLDLRFNKIRDIPKGAFSNLGHLTTLLLNNNHLTVIRDKAFDGLSNLQYLYLYKNRIHHMDDGAFDGLGNMKYLYLHFNKIESFSSNVFPDLPSLERLFLHNNRIKHIPPGAFDELPMLRRLRLDSNALVCDCSITWFMKMVHENNHDGTHLQAAATCGSPSNMKGLSIVNMENNDLHCEEPTIKAEPEDIEVTFGNVATFTCQVQGDPLPEIKWMKDSQELQYYNTNKYEILEDGSLKIDSLDQADEGYYECIAKNPLGVKKSRVAKMVINSDGIPTEYPPKFTQTPVSETISNNRHSLELICGATGIPHPHITWYHNGRKMMKSERIKVVNGGNIIILNPTVGDIGEYKCEAENIHGKIHATADIHMISSPKDLVMEKEPPVYKLGQQLVLKCTSTGNPTPVTTWYKDGIIFVTTDKVKNEDNKLMFSSLEESDSGNYVCRAENLAGFSETYTDINVKKYSVKVPHLVYKPYDVEALSGSKIELPCKSEGNPKPEIGWKKDGTHVFTSDRHKIVHSGSLYISNVSVQDSGRYECTAINQYGRATASGFVTILPTSFDKPGDKFVKIAFAEATQEIELAINQTVETLFHNGSANLNMGDLYRIIRYPNAADRELAKAAEIYERTLINIRRRVNAGNSVNINKDFNYKELLSPEHLVLVAKLSGCISHRLTTNCYNMCFNSKYRSIDGTCNNFNNPTWGASNTGFRRLLKPIYENGFGQPVGWSKEKKYNNFSLPSARLVSSKLITTKEITPDSQITHMVMQWGQFLDHDLDHATPSVSSQSWDGIDCKRSCEYAAPCFPIDIPKGDTRIGNRRCMDFIRSSSVCGSGMTSVFFEGLQPREQINQLTSYIDASQVYGFADYVAKDLRNLTTNDGLLRSGVIFPGKKALLPYSSGEHEMDCRKGALEDNIKCFAAGDIRANEQVGLLAMHTLWFREHNRIASELKQLNPHWNGDIIYYEARKIVGALMQHITYNHWLPIILGKSGMEKLGTYKRYDPTINPTIANVFATAALRFGHSLINPELQRLDNNFNEIPEGHLPLHKAFFASWRLVEEGGIDPLIRGLFTVPAKLKTPSQNLNSDLTEKLFHIAHAVALDLAAMNIQRSRDHAIPPYTEWRKFCNMSDAHSFDDLKNEISNDNVRQKLEELYGSVHNIDVWVGGILEDQIEGGKVGPLFQCLLIDQFQRLRDGDRFWYENPTVFRQEQLFQIKQATLSRILCDNGDNINKVTNDVFFLPEVQGGYMACDNIPKVDLRIWTDCAECEDGFCPAITTTLSTPSNRQNSPPSSLLNDVDKIEKFQPKTIEEYKNTVKMLKEAVDKMKRTLDSHEEYVKKLQADCSTECAKDQN